MHEKVCVCACACVCAVASHRTESEGNTMKVMTKIYRSWLNCQIDTCTDEGLETSDHFSSYRLSLKQKPLSRLREGGGELNLL